MASIVMPRNGTTLRELDVILISPVVWLPFSSCCCYFLPLCLAGGSTRILRIRLTIEFLLEFVVLIVPLLFMYTVAADHLTTFLAVGGSLTAALQLCSLRRKKRTLSAIVSAFGQPCTAEMGREFLTHYRSYIYVSTIICILAVDFTVFPRRFFKTEVYGKGLMDVGVGCYVISGGIVSRISRQGTLRDVTSRPAAEAARELASSMKTAAVLMIVGAGRYAVTAATKYHTANLTEYGVHWNFFVTLSVVRLAGGILLLTRRWIRPWIWFLILSIIHQMLLTSQLTAFVAQQGARDGTGVMGFVRANREGIVSCLGCLAIHMAGVAIGQMLTAASCLGERGRDCSYTGSSYKAVTNGVAATNGVADQQSCKTDVQPAIGNRLQLLLRLLLWSVVALVGVVICERYVEPVSRRTANAGYILWMIHLNLLLIAANLVAAILRSAYDAVPEAASGLIDSEAMDRAETRLPSAAQTVPLMAAVNQNGLLVFLFANILTGLINIYMKTLTYEKPAAILILGAYLLANCLLARLLHCRGIRIF